MKVRTGLVSNSSTSSFVVAGFKVDPEVSESFGNQTLNGFPISGINVGHDEDIIGYYLASVDDYGQDEETINLAGLQKALEEAHQIVRQATGEDVNPIKIFSGMEYC